MWMFDMFGMVVFLLVKVILGVDGVMVYVIENLFYIGG